MASKNIPDKKQQKAPTRAGAKKRDELDAKDLDKVTGGMRSTGNRTGDPCDGGE